MTDTTPLWPESIPKLIPLALVALSLGALGTAYTAQYKFGLEPCILCLYQRIPYAVIGVLGIFGYLVRGSRLIWIVTLLAGVTFAAGAVLGFYHVGVEQHWWVSAASCGDAGTGSAGQSVQDFLKALQAKPVKACDQVDWTLFGISMATYNAVFSAFAAVIAVAAALKIRRAS